MKKVSLIIPAYNEEDTISACLKSALEQDYKPLEIIVVDNNSTDKTKSIIKHLEKRNKVIKYVFEPQRKRGAARNTGLRHSTGGIVALTDADCTLPANWIRKMVEPILKHGEKIVTGNEIIDGTDFVSRQRARHRKAFMEKRINGRYINHMDTKTCAIDKTVFSTIGPFNKTLLHSEDKDIGIKMLSNKYRIFYRKDCCVIHSHRLSLIDWMKQQISKSYWAQACYEMNKDALNKLPAQSYNKMGWSEFFFFFFQAPMSLIFGKKRKNILFDVVSGVAWRIGIVNHKIHKLHQVNYLLRRVTKCLVLVSRKY